MQINGKIVYVHESEELELLKCLLPKGSIGSMQHLPKFHWNFYRNGTNNPKICMEWQKILSS